MATPSKEGMQFPKWFVTPDWFDKLQEVIQVTLRAMRAVMNNPEVYAAKLQSDDPLAIAFKNAKTITSLQQMLEISRNNWQCRVGRKNLLLHQSRSLPRSHRQLSLHFQGNKK